LEDLNPGWGDVPLRHGTFSHEMMASLEKVTDKHINDAKIQSKARSTSMTNLTLRKVPMLRCPSSLDPLAYARYAFPRDSGDLPMELFPLPFEKVLIRLFYDFVNI